VNEGEDRERAERERRELRATGGLCPRCVHVRRIDSAKGSTFWLCQRAATDASFPRYPPQPRMECAGFER
jgi:hypothetical protein